MCSCRVEAMMAAWRAVTRPWRGEERDGEVGQRVTAVTGIEVLAPREVGGIVAFGDSLTEGNIHSSTRTTAGQTNSRGDSSRGRAGASAGVVNEDRHAAEFLLNSLEQRDDGTLVGNVGLNRHRNVAANPKVARGVFCGNGIDVGDHHRRTGAGQQRRDLLAEASARPGDHGHFALQAKRVFKHSWSTGIGTPLHIC
jgi:hypothetical protein